MTEKRFRLNLLLEAIRDMPDSEATAYIAIRDFGIDSKVQHDVRVSDDKIAFVRRAITEQNPQEIVAEVLRESCIPFDHMTVAGTVIERLVRRGFVVVFTGHVPVPREVEVEERKSYFDEMRAAS